MNIVLCGMPMSGKTTIGKMLSEKLCLNFIDIDVLIEDAYAKTNGKYKSNRQIFLDHGEKYFRVLEKEQIASITHVKESVIATGGGAICDHENVPILRSIGRVVYLHATLEVLWRRIGSRNIPAYLEDSDPKKDFYGVLEQRVPLYKACAHFTIDIDVLTKEQIVEEINKRLVYGQ